METKYPGEWWEKQRTRPICFVSRNQKHPGRHFYCFLETKHTKNPGLFPMFPFPCVSTSTLILLKLKLGSLDAFNLQGWGTWGMTWRWWYFCNKEGGATETYAKKIKKEGRRKTEDGTEGASGRLLAILSVRSPLCFGIFRCAGFSTACGVVQFQYSY